jgi:HAD superfamily hydrolase (TIGR01549 family)
MRYDAVLFDLFRTVIVYTPAAPTAKVREPHWRTAMGALRPRAADLLPGVEFDRFLDALVAVSEEIRRARPPEYLEVPIAERYRRALERLECHGTQAEAIARELSGLQLEVQAANSTLPAAHRELLESLRGRFRLATVSNFDHAATVHSLLARLGLDRLFSAAVISIEFGRRKPHPTIFREALRRIDSVPQRTLFVGDSLTEDVAGAQSVGLDAAWIDRHGRGVRKGRPMPTYVIRELGEVAKLLRG